MGLKLTRGTGDGHDVSEMILGHNIEMCLGAANGLLSERLRNPKFLGPSHPMTGIAPHWMGTTYGTAAYELTPFGGLNGSEAQSVRVLKTPGGNHLVQNRVQVRAGEELELEIWARAWHEPVTVRATLMPLRARAKHLDSGEVVIDKPYFARYVIPLSPTEDDDEARVQLTLVGGGEVWFDQVHLRPSDEPHLCQGVIDAIKGMRIPTLRFPGGIIVNSYHWKHGTGPVHLRPSTLDAAFHHDWYLNYDFGLDEFLQLCAEERIVPAITLNPATGTPQQARELAEYCRDWFRQRDLEPPLIYWHVGNHPYGGTTAGMTPEMYVNVIREFVPGVKDAYPNGRVVAATSGGELDADAENAAWREALFGDVAELIDVVEVQLYGGCNERCDPEDQVAQLVKVISTVEPRLRSFISMCRDRGVKWKVGVAEWNWWMRASHWDGRDFEELPTVLHCLHIAGMIHRFVRLQPDLEVAHFYNLVNCMGIINHSGPEVEVTDAVAVFNLYRPAVPGRYVPVEMGSANEYVEALAIENDEGLYIFLMNRSASESATVLLDGFDLEGAACLGFVGRSPVGLFSHTAPDLAGNTVELPALSITRIILGE